MTNLFPWGWKTLKWQRENKHSRKQRLQHINENEHSYWIREYQRLLLFQTTFSTCRTPQLLVYFKILLVNSSYTFAARITTLKVFIASTAGFCFFSAYSGSLLCKIYHHEFKVIFSLKIILLFMNSLDIPSRYLWYQDFLDVKLKQDSAELYLFSGI